MVGALYFFLFSFFPFFLLGAVVLFAGRPPPRQENAGGVLQPRARRRWSVSVLFVFLFFSSSLSSLLGTVVLFAGRPLWQNEGGVACSATTCAATVVCMGVVYIIQKIEF